MDIFYGLCRSCDSNAQHCGQANMISKVRNGQKGYVVMILAGRKAQSLRIKSRQHYVILFYIKEDVLP